MTLATRLAVMQDGRFMQTGTPAEVYEFPQSEYIADFFGNVNLFAATVVAVEPGHLTAALDGSGTEIRAACDRKLDVGSRCKIGVRPEKLLISQDHPQDPAVTVTRGVVEDLAYYGNRSIYRVRSENGRIIQVSSQNYRRSSQHSVEWDDEVFLSWDSSCTMVLTE